MADVVKLDKAELAERYQRAKNMLARARESTREVTRRGTTVALGAAGGFAAGVLEEKFPEIGGIPTSAAVGLGVALIGVLDGAGDASDSLVALGSGMLAGAAYGQGRKFGAEIDI